MKCQNHPNAAAIEHCARCETPLCGMCANFTADDVLCEPCVEIRENERAVAAQTQKLDQPEPETIAQEYDEKILEAAKKKKSNSAVWQIGIILCCGVILATRLVFFSNPAANAPDISPEVALQIQTLSSLGECLLVFQGVSEALSAGQAIDPLTSCPDSNQPLIVRDTGDDVIVFHPAPENLGYAEISVSRSNPEPNLVQDF